MDRDNDYITINPAVRSGFWNVVIMRSTHGEYYVYRCSAQMTRIAAESLARCWEAATGLEVR